MKTMIKNMLIAGIITLSFSGNIVNAQPTPPGGSYNHGTGGDQQSGGGAPIDGGLSILLALGAAYGGKTVYGRFKKLNK